MTMSRDEKLAYQRGYQNGAERWPLHKPPVPPQPVIALLVTALRGLRDECDSALAVFDKDDPLEKAIGPRIAEADAALSAVSAWLRSDNAEPPQASGERGD